MERIGSWAIAVLWAYGWVIVLALTTILLVVLLFMAFGGPDE